MISIKTVIRTHQTSLLAFLCLPVLSMAGMLPATDTGAEIARPNILLILTDDQGFSDVGFNGNPLVQTPHLDTFAAEAVIFNRFYAQPACSPTRASLMTGRYPMRTGVVDTQEGMSILRPSEITIAEVLKMAGYRTGMFGKWHLGDNAPARPVDQGFDHYLTHVGGMIGAPYSPLDANSYFDPVLIEDGIEKPFQGYCLDIFTDAAVDFIQDSGNNPFFVYYAPNTPHHPLTVADRYAEPYLAEGLSVETSRYYGMLTNIDDNFGRLLEALEEAGKMKNTLIIFVGDNGTSSLHHQDDLWESGLRARKMHVYENGIRVPAFFKLPDAQANGERLDDRAAIEDVMPTILDACGLPSPDALDGISLVPLLDGETESLPERSLFFQFHRGLSPDKYRNMSVIRGDWKLVQPVGRGSLDFSLEDMHFELYNLKQDPFEEHNLVAAHPGIVEQLKSEYDAWFDDVTSAGFEPVPTWIGAEGQGKLLLSRQDWRGGGLFDGDLGYYEIDVRTAGTYRITCRWSELFKDARTSNPVTLKIGDQVLRKEILYAEAQCRFDQVYLPEGPSQLEAWVEIDGKRNGFRFIEIEKLTEQELFESAAMGKWQNAFEDIGTGDWTEQWFLDGEVGTVTTGPDGMELTAGPEFLDDAHHMVLWTKQSFQGDVKIEYDYTRLDDETRCVNILYIQATGSGEAPYVEDIAEWKELRRVPAMRMYFDHMNTYHISYAAFPNDDDATSYIRGRRYMPNQSGLEGTGLEPDYYPEGLFKPGVPHKIAVIKKERDLFMRVENPEQVSYFHMANPDLPPIEEGRIGLRQMFTRSAVYKNFRVSVRSETETRNVGKIN